LSVVEGRENVVGCFADWALIKKVPEFFEFHKVCYFILFFGPYSRKILGHIRFAQDKRLHPPPFPKATVRAQTAGEEHAHMADLVALQRELKVRDCELTLSPLSLPQAPQIKHNAPLHPTWVFVLLLRVHYHSFDMTPPQSGTRPNPGNCL